MSETTETTEITQYQNPNALLALAVQQNADIDKLERLMQLQERWEAGEAKKAFMHAMTQFKKNPPRIMKESKVDYTSQKGRVNYNYASIGNVVETVTEALSKCELTANWKTEQRDNGSVSVTCIITHVMGHSESTSMVAPPDNSGGKNNIQAIGSTVSYLQRYTLLAITGLATNEFEDDGNKGQRPGSQQAKPQNGNTKQQTAQPKPQQAAKPQNGNGKQADVKSRLESARKYLDREHEGVFADILDQSGIPKDAPIDAIDSEAYPALLKACEDFVHQNKNGGAK